jgi:hypothetical protein
MDCEYSYFAPLMNHHVFFSVSEDWPSDLSTGSMKINSYVPIKFLTKIGIPWTVDSETITAS